MKKLLIAAAWLILPLTLPADSLDDEKERLRSDAVAGMVETLGIRESQVPVRELPGWAVPQKVVVRLDKPERLPALQAVAPGVELVAVSGQDEAAAAVVDAQVLIGFCNEELVSSAPQLVWVQVFSAGVERCVSIPGMKTGNKVLTNGQRIASPALAEHAIAMMMSLVRGLDVYHASQLNGTWRRDADLGAGEFMELEGRTVLVVGLGGIGTQTAKRAHGLGMRVVATRNSSRQGPAYIDYVGLSDELLSLAAQADVVINTAPLTDKTRGMFDAAFFATMKSTAYFISVGRGASTVTADLISALESGSIAGAGLDVTDPEPLPEGHPLWSAPRIVISPHVAARSDKSRDRLYLLVQENLRRFVAGEPLLSVVDIERGY
ncbi:MAG: D-2-hydroxyacid dehydrogenase [Xanthomonadales bacterium]|nr:D-2-hydroxyacid dehydrogenase [Gammaproteobacteria bacterium]NND58266.1 D-2-hydroxyacid dehydrogenase [Xanthomonadales bacterium]NNK52023.1 D-2-hydroxyacid dehydrogenase [Xanthomonadales bacterium]